MTYHNEKIRGNDRNMHAAKPVLYLGLSYLYTGIPETPPFKARKIKREVKIAHERKKLSAWISNA